ncbi:uncharacterized protein METZ01_LOCUS418945, partial [marine metagenome]
RFHRRRPETVHVAVVVYRRRRFAQHFINADQDRQLDPSFRRQRQRGTRPRGRRQPHKNQALYALRCDGGFRRCYQLNPHRRCQPQQRHRLRTRSHRHGRNRRHRPYRRPRHHYRHRVRHLHLAPDAQWHRIDRRARPGLQHIHRHHHPRHDGPALVARSPTPGRRL